MITVSRKARCKSQRDLSLGLLGSPSGQLRELGWTDSRGKAWRDVALRLFMFPDWPQEATPRKLAPLIPRKIFPQTHTHTLHSGGLGTDHLALSCLGCSDSPSPGGSPRPPPGRAAQGSAFRVWPSEPASSAAANPSVGSLHCQGASIVPPGRSWAAPSFFLSRLLNSPLRKHNSQGAPAARRSRGSGRGLLWDGV